jgi:hypothetical protein
MSKKDKVSSISKILSPNDIGKTGTHQAGILIPKRGGILSFFPGLNSNRKNPRHFLTFYDDEGQPWHFAFIYYNNKLFSGTRNEYRLTRMTRYLRSNNLKPGDTLSFKIGADGTRQVSFRRRVQPIPGKLVLSPGWKVIRIKK